MARLYSGADMARDLQRQAQNESMRHLLTAWDKEIEAAFEHLRQQAAEQAQVQKAEASEARRKRSLEAQDRALAAAVSSYLQQAANVAEDGGLPTLSIPTGYRAASLVLAGPAVGEINALLSDIQHELKDRGDDPALSAQASATWALGAGLAPHPADLATILGAAQIDPSYGERFEDLARQLASLEGPQPKHGQLKGFAGHQKIDVLQDHVKVMGAFGAPRLINVLGHPASLIGTTATNAPPTRGVVDRKVLDGVLDKLFS